MAKATEGSGKQRARSAPKRRPTMGRKNPYLGIAPWDFASKNLFVKYYNRNY